MPTSLSQNMDPRDLRRLNRRWACKTRRSARRAAPSSRPGPRPRGGSGAPRGVSGGDNFDSPDGLSDIDSDSDSDSEAHSNPHDRLIRALIEEHRQKQDVAAKAIVTPRRPRDDKAVVDGSGDSSNFDEDATPPQCQRAVPLQEKRSGVDTKSECSKKSADSEAARTGRDTHGNNPAHPKNAKGCPAPPVKAAKGAPTPSSVTQVRPNRVTTLASPNPRDSAAGAAPPAKSRAIQAAISTPNKTTMGSAKRARAAPAPCASPAPAHREKPESSNPEEVLEAAVPQPEAVKAPRPDKSHDYGSNKSAAILPRDPPIINGQSRVDGAGGDYHVTFHSQSLGFSLGKAGSSLKASKAGLKGDGLVVLSVSRGSASASARVTRGDKLMTIAGTEINGWSPEKVGSFIRSQARPLRVSFLKWNHSKLKVQSEQRKKAAESAAKRAAMRMKAKAAKAAKTKAREDAKAARAAKAKALAREKAERAEARAAARAAKAAAVAAAKAARAEARAAAKAAKIAALAKKKRNKMPKIACPYCRLFTTRSNGSSKGKLIRECMNDACPTRFFRVDKITLQPSVYKNGHRGPQQFRYQFDKAAQPLAPPPPKTAVSAQAQKRKRGNSVVEEESAAAKRKVSVRSV